MKVGVVCYPGSTCDQEAMEVIRRLGHQPVALWVEEHDLKGSGALILPGGLSAGDAMRCGSIARRFALMDEVVAFARRGGPVLGFCDGFQMLIELGVLPGLLLPGASRRFVARMVELQVENTDSPFTRRFERGEHIHALVAHMEAHYFLDAEALRRLEDEGRVAFRFVDGAETVFHGVAGLLNEWGNVLGMMPHPERATMGATRAGSDGRRLFESFLS